MEKWGKMWSFPLGLEVGGIDPGALVVVTGMDVTNLLKGLGHLCFAFQELAIINVALGILQVAAAAAAWPVTTVYITVKCSLRPAAPSSPCTTYKM